MNTTEDERVLRLLAAVAGVPNPDGVRIEVTPYKDFSWRSCCEGWVVATAVGWPSDVTDGDVARSAKDEATAINGLIEDARWYAQHEVEAAKREAERLSDVARAATTAAANAEADAETRRLMLASIDTPAAPAPTRATHYAVLLLAPEMVDGVVKARVIGVHAYADGHHDFHARSIAMYSRRRIVNVPADTRVGSVVDVRPWG